MKNRKISIIVIAMFTVIALTGCASFDRFLNQFEQSFVGLDATMTTYTEYGQKIDEVRGNSFKVDRDTRFDFTTGVGENETTTNGDVLLISLGDNSISHVGSTMILADHTVDNLIDSVPTGMSFENTDRGMPWINNMVEYWSNDIRGESRLLSIRSQDGTPVAVFSGNNVEMVKTTVPKSTAFYIDGKYVFVYRADYTVYDTALLK